MASFQELYDISKEFRCLFIHTGVYKSADQIDVGKAEYLWSERFPKIEWGFCAHEGCNGLVEVGTYCEKHTRPGLLMPRWKWVNGVLYNNCKPLNKTHSISGRDFEYVNYSRYQMERKGGGSIPAGYTVACLDDNLFNLRRENLVLVTKITGAAIQAGVINTSEALAVDEVISEKYEAIKRKGRPMSAWGYNYASIAKAAKVKVARVRQAVSRGKLEPGNLESVVDFCKRVGKSDKV